MGIYLSNYLQYQLTSKKLSQWRNQFKWSDGRDFFRGALPSDCLLTGFPNRTLNAASLILESTARCVPTTQVRLLLLYGQQKLLELWCGWKDVEVLSNRCVKVSQQLKARASVRLESCRQILPLPVSSVRLIDLKGNERWHMHAVSKGTPLSPEARRQLKRGQSDAFLVRGTLFPLRNATGSSGRGWTAGPHLDNMSLPKQRGRELERFDGLSLIYWYVQSERGIGSIHHACALRSLRERENATQNFITNLENDTCH